MKVNELAAFLEKLTLSIFLLLGMAYAAHASEYYTVSESAVLLPVKPDRALLYFVRVGHTSPDDLHKVFVDETPIGFLPDDAYTAAFVEPGLRLIWGSNASEWFSLSAGRTYLLRAHKAPAVWLLDEPTRIRELANEFKLTHVTVTEAGLAALGHERLKKYKKLRKRNWRRYQKALREAEQSPGVTLPITFRAGYKKKLEKREHPLFAAGGHLTVGEKLVRFESTTTLLEMPAEDIQQVSYGGSFEDTLPGGGGAVWLHVRYQAEGESRDAFFSDLIEGSPLGIKGLIEIDFLQGYNAKFAAISEAVEHGKTSEKVALSEPLRARPTQKKKETASAPYRMAIFPAGGKFGWSADAGLEERVARTLQTSIQEDRALVLAYSYYDDVLNEPRIKNPERLWVGGEVRKKPNLDVVYRLAREHAVDGVVMCWGGQLGTSWATGTPDPLWVYLIDVERRQVYRREGTTKENSVRKLTKQVFADFMKWRGGVASVEKKAGYRFDGNWVGSIRCGSCAHCIGPLEKPVKISVERNSFELILDGTYQGRGSIDPEGGMTIIGKPSVERGIPRIFDFQGRLRAGQFTLRGQRGPRSCRITLQRPT